MEEAEMNQTKIKTKPFRPITYFFCVKNKMLLDAETSNSCNNDLNSRFN